MDKKLLAIGTAFLGLTLFWVVQRRDDSERALAESAGGANPRNLQESMRTFEKALNEAQERIQEGYPLESARKLYHVFPGFESYLNAQGFEEIEPGLTLNAWFEAKKTAFADVLSNEYPKLAQRLKSGDSTWREMNAFFSEMPFPFIHELRRTYEKDRREIAAARATQAPGWCFLSVIAISGSGERYEQIVREALQARWNPQSGYKLVFDNPSSGEESRAAAKIINVRIEEHFAEYAFQRDPNRAGGKVAESAWVHFSSGNSGNTALKTNWEVLQPLSVTNEAPEVLRFQFENQRQSADFSDVAARQRRALEEKLVAALEAVPPFEVLSSAQ